MGQVTPSKTAKELGCKSLAQVSQLTGIPVSTLKDWHKQKPETFNKLCKLVGDKIMSTLTIERREKMEVMSRWLVSHAVKNFSYLNNSAISPKCSAALQKLSSNNFDSLDSFLSALKDILEGVPIAFDDKIMRAKIYYSEAKVNEFVEAKYVYIKNVEKAIKVLGSAK